MSARAALVAAIIVASVACAGGAQAAPANPPKVSSLPAADIPDLPLRSRPAAIGAGERVPGFSLVRPSTDYGSSKRARVHVPDYLQVYATEAAATFAMKGQGTRPLGDTTCFIGHQNRDRNALLVEWSSSFVGTATLHGQDGTNVYPLRSEQLIVDPDGSAKLVVAQAWVDLKTRGARLVSRSTIPLAPIATGPRGLQVYAARRGDTVEIVVAPPAAARAQPFSLGLQFQQSNGFAGVLSQCGHIRFGLSTQGDGDMVTVQADVPLPPREGERRADNRIAEALGLDKLPPDQQSNRARLLRVGISTTKTSQDKEALLSVAMGWVGKERNLF